MKKFGLAKLKISCAWAAPFVGIALSFAALAVLGSRPEPSSLHLSAILLLLLLFLCSLSGWGAALGRAFGQGSSFVTALLWGSMLFSGVMVAASAIGFLGDGTRWFFRLFLWTGYFFLSWLPWRALRSTREYRSLPMVLSALIVLFFFAPLLNGALIGSFHQDALAYHLYAPWKWWTEGRLFFPASHPELLWASYWDYLYLWGFPLFGAQESALYSVLVFSQLLHLSLGFCGSFACLALLFRSLDVRREYCLLAAFFGLTIFPLLWTSWLAKNDYGALFWFLGSLLFVREEKFRTAGFSAGMALAAKISLIFPLLILFLSLFRREMRAAPRFGALLLVALLPHVMRNWLFVGNPFFPAFQKLIAPEIASGTMIQFAYSEIAKYDQETSSLLAILFHIFRLEPLLLLSMLLFLSLLVAKKLEARKWKSLLALAVLPIAVAIPVMAESARNVVTLRFLAPSLCLANALPIAFLGAFRRVQARVWVRVPLLLLLLGLIFLSRPYYPRHFETPVFTGGSYAARYAAVMPAGACKQWLSGNAPHDASMVFLEDDYLYLLPFRNLRVATHDPALDSLLRGGSPPEEIFREMKRQDVKYVMGTSFREGNHFYPRSKEVLTWMLSADLVAYQARDCVVLDLRELRL